MNYLTPIRLIEKKDDYAHIWLFQCKCGNQYTARLKDFKNSKTRSCGCLKKQILSDRNYKHGQRNTRIYRIWSAIRARCENKNTSNYRFYGERGVLVEWKDFESFYKDMIGSYNNHVEIFGENQTTIDRIDVNGNYCKENCRWATWNEQFNNRRKKHETTN